MSSENNVDREFRLSQAKLRKAFEASLNDLNANHEYQPQLFDLEKKEERISFAAFCNNNEIVSFDSTLLNLIKLYTRFNPQDKALTGENAHANLRFRKWLKENGLVSNEDGPHLLYCLNKLVLPHGLNSKGQMVWDVVSVLPEGMQRKLQEASMNKMIDEKTQKALHDDVELFVLGASVGSNIVASLVPSLGIDHVTILDPKPQDGVGSSRVANSSTLIHGKSKAIALWHNLLEANPYIKCNAYPVAFSKENAGMIFKGTMPQNPNRVRVIIEEFDDLKAKDELRQYVRENFKDQKVLIISFADTGITSIGGVIETPEDPPYNGNALNYGKDPYAVSLNPIAKIMKTYGLVTPSTSNPKPQDLKIPPELLGSLARLFTGQIASFEQSGLASRMTGPVAGQILISFLEGTLDVKTININLSKDIDAKWKDRKFVKKVHKAVRQLQKKLDIKKTRRKM
ncbi:MAG TPA: hypothetical protein VF185_02250 [Patescibacteria group bacterium]